MNLKPVPESSSTIEQRILCSNCFKWKPFTEILSDLEKPPFTSYICRECCNNNNYYENT